ncbi:TonB-dependent receptor [Spongiibacter sp. KMU-166]|uniref:TonB-dependent receptor n=1 Tax=Spongiibacter thalassae TaxID=2721624 RepID=A0ABX1GEB8_9GAMM|nr:TonB-dependent receptor [Spongiibacter thalassae]NKI17537.1 TonB-dependent receptor [Spongiibacter thalassae]
MTDTSTTRVPYPRRLSTLAAALALLTSNSSVVMAQAAANSSYALEEIVVTAEKRAENVNDVPIAINAFSGDGLEKAGVKSMADLAMKTPGLVYDTLVNYAVIFIRGVGTDAFIPSADLSVAPYIDGVYFPISFGLARSLGEVERVEVLKGPQGTLFGRNSTGGAISITTRQPSETHTLKAASSYERFEENNNRVYMSGPLSERLAVSGALIYNTREDYYTPVDEVSYDQLQPYRERGVNLSARWIPTEWAEAQLSAYYFDSQGVGTSLLACLQPSQLGASLGISCAPDYKANTNINNTAFSLLKAGALTLQFYPGPFDIKSITAYQDTNGQSLVDFDGSNANLVEFGGDGTQKENFPQLFGEIFSQELQMISNTDSRWNEQLEWIVGLYYTDSTVGYDPVGFALGGLNNGLSGALGGSPPLPADFSAFSPILDAFGGALSPLDELVQAKVTVTGSLDTVAASAFSQITWTPLHWLDITLGGRYQREKRRVFNANLYINTQVAGQQPQTNANQYPDEEFEESNFSPKLTLSASPAEGQLVYASYQQAFKSGSYNIVNLTQSPTFIRPETVATTELGVKSSLFERRLQINAAMFRTEIDDLQSQFVSLMSGGVVQFQNAELATVEGADFDIQWAASPAWKFTLGASYLRGRYERFDDAVGYTEAEGGFSGSYSDDENYSGNTIVRNPELTATFGANWFKAVPGGELNIGLDYYYNDGYYFDAANQLEQDAYTVLNARLTYTHDDSNVDISLFGGNLEGSRYYIYQFQTDFGIVGKLAKPESYGIRVNWHYDDE